MRSVIFASVLSILGASIPAAAQVPDWAAGSFTGRNPSTGGSISLTIERNGTAILVVNGSTSYGIYSRERLTVGGGVSKVSRIGKGIRTIRTDNGERIDYVRGNGPGVSNPASVPSWAVGTFDGNSGNGMAITLTITSSGSVTANIGGKVFYGTISGEMLTLSGASARVSLLSNGISTVRTDNGERIDYSRRGGGVDSNGSVQMGDVPDWAVGTFYAANPSGNGSIVISINSSGRVTVDVGGTLISGTMHQTRLTLNDVKSEVTRVRNGIRTRRFDNGETIDYFKR